MINQTASSNVSLSALAFLKQTEGDQHLKVTKQYSRLHQGVKNTKTANKLGKKLQLNQLPNKLKQVKDNLSSQEISDLLNSYDAYQLDDLKSANLMNRVDSKFILPISFLPKLLQQLKAHYRVLDINEQRCFTYYNEYLDTPEMAFYYAHHNGKLNRYKVRRRHYVDTATEFLEVKFKNNQKRTIKSRIKLSSLAELATSTSLNSMAGEEQNFLEQQLHMPVNELAVTQCSGYQRIALANEVKAERLTLDFGLWYKKPSSDSSIELPHFFIAELKQHKKNKQSPFYQLMSQNAIFPLSFSKYCIGCAMLYRSSIKTNRFKPAFTRVKALHRPTQSFLFKSN